MKKKPESMDDALKAFLQKSYPILLKQTMKDRERFWKWITTAKKFPKNMGSIK